MYMLMNVGAELYTILIVAFVGPWLSLTSMEEHLHAAPHQILPAWTHSGVRRALLFNFNQFTWNRRFTTEIIQTQNGQWW